MIERWSLTFYREQFPWLTDEQWAAFDRKRKEYAR